MEDYIFWVIVSCVIAMVIYIIYRAIRYGCSSRSNGDSDGGCGCFDFDFGGDGDGGCDGGSSD